MKRLLSFTLAVVLVGALCAQPPVPVPPPIVTIDDLSVVGDIKTVLVINKFPITIKAPQDGGAMHWWQFPDGVMGVDNGDSLEVSAAPAGEVSVTVRYAVPIVDWDKKTFKLVNRVLTKTLYNGFQPPKPPDPPDPKVDVPVKVDGLSVLVIYDKPQLTSLPKDQRSLIDAVPFRGVLDAMCTIGPDGLRSWRIWDTTVKGDAIKNAPAWAQQALNRPRSQLPWIGIYGKSQFYEGPLHVNQAEVTAALQKIKGV